MLYLLKQETRTHDSYKVGFAEDADKRFQNYLGHNRNIIEVSRRPGDRSEETLLHHYLHCFPDLWDFHRSEWYDCKIGDDQIEKYFEHPWEDIKEKVWNSRDNLLNPRSISDQQLWKKLWDSKKPNSYDLYFKNGKDHLIGEGILGMDTEFYYLTSDAPPFIDLSGETDERVIQFFSEYSKFSNQESRLKYMCGSLDSNIRDLVLRRIPDIDPAKSMYMAFGPDKCKASGYNFSYLNKIGKIITFDRNLLREAIYYQFKEGDRYSLKDFKRVLGQIYEQLKYTAKPKASDIEEFFEAKRVTIMDSGKKINGYELLKKLR